MNHKLRNFLYSFLIASLLCGFSAWRITPGLQQQLRNNQLLAAIQRDDTNAVAFLLNQGASPNARGYAGAASLSLGQIFRERFSRAPSGLVNESALRIALKTQRLHTGTSFSPSYNANIDIVTMLLQKGAVFDLKSGFYALVYKGHFHHGDQSPYIDLEELCKDCTIRGDIGEFVGTEQQTDALMCAALKAGARRR